jgi:hypothetical protein
VSGRDVFAVDVGRALEALDFAWGDVYEIGHEDGIWLAESRDGRGRRLTGKTPDELNAAMRADWAEGRAR